MGMPTIATDPLGLYVRDCVWTGNCSPCPYCIGGPMGGGGGGGGDGGYGGQNAGLQGINFVGLLWSIESQNENGWYQQLVDAGFNAGNYPAGQAPQFRMPLPLPAGMEEVPGGCVTTTDGFGNTSSACFDAFVLPEQQYMYNFTLLPLAMQLGRQYLQVLATSGGDVQNQDHNFYIYRLSLALDAPLMTPQEYCSFTAYVGVPLAAAGGVPPITGALGLAEGGGAWLIGGGGIASSVGGAVCASY